MQDQASAEASAQKVAAELLAEEEQAAVRAAAKKAKKLRQKQAKKQPPQAAKAHSGLAEHSVPKDVPTHSADESEPLKGEGHADHTDSAPSAAKQNCSETALQDSPPSKSAAVSKACTKEEPKECSSTASAHSEAHVLDGAEASCDATAARHAAAAAAALSACSLAQSPETGLAPSGSSAAKASDVESSAQHADAIFLKDLFCCPITQVSHPSFCSCLAPLAHSQMPGTAQTGAMLDVTSIPGLSFSNACAHLGADPTQLQPALPVCISCDAQPKSLSMHTSNK